MRLVYFLACFILLFSGLVRAERPRVIVTTDGEADDRCSMVRFLLHSNDFEVEGIINSSSQFHWVGGSGWNTFHPVTWVKDFIDSYAQVYDNLLLHDKAYPSPDYLLSKWKVGNIEGNSEMDKRTEGAVHIANVILDETDPRPIWIQAWGGSNTIARALKIIQQDYPEKMAYAAAKVRLFLIWEQDDTYQSYIRPNWEEYNITTIISDQFDCMAYIWNKVLPEDIKQYFGADFMAGITKDHGVLCAAYRLENGAFHAEGDTPAFLHCIDNGLRSLESPGWGGWGGRYVKVRNNVWLDPVPDSSYSYTAGKWCFANSWSKQLENRTDPEGIRIRTNYFKPIWRWLPYVQRDFAARADWCVKPFDQANHHPQIAPDTMTVSVLAKETVDLEISAVDPDGDKLSYLWWQYQQAGSYKGDIAIENANSRKASFIVPEDIAPGETIHIVCTVADDGTPSLARFKRVVAVCGLDN